jgi:hypothetical protein
MKKQNRNIFKRKYIAIILVICALLLILLALEKTHITNFIKLPPDGSASNSGPTAEEKKKETEANADAKKDFIEGNNTEPTTNQPQSSSIDLSTKQEVTGDVTVLTKLYNYPSGDCHLSISNSGKTYSADAQVIYQPEYSSCAGFSVPSSTVGKGTWTITLKVSYNGTTGIKTTTLEVK